MQAISGGIEDNEIRCDCGVEWETTGTDRQGSEEEESEGVGERKGQIQVEWKRGKVRERGRKREVEKKEKERERDEFYGKLNKNVKWKPRAASVDK